MADVQIEYGYTQIANQILEVLAQTPLNGTQMRILLIILRYTYGFNRKQAELSVNYIAKASEINERQIRRELKTLINYNIVKIIKEATFNTPRIIAFNKNYEEWTNSTQKIKKTVAYKLDLSPVGELDPTTQDKLDPQEIKDINKDIKKESNKEIYDTTLFSDNLNSKISEWLKYKKERRETYKPTGLNSFIKQLKKKVDEFEEEPVIELIELCMSNNWKGIIWDRLKTDKPKEVSKWNPL